MSLRKTFLAPYFYRIVDRMLPAAVRMMPHPGQYTALGLLLAAAVPFGFFIHPVFGLLLIIASGVVDGMDGAIARKTGTASRCGAFMDSTADRIADFFYLTGFWILFWESKRLILASALIFLAFLFSFMISYVKARAESLGTACEIGLMERGWRTLYLIGWAFFLSIFPSAYTAVLWGGLVLLCILTLLTVIQRIVSVRSSLSTGIGKRD